VSGTSSRGLRPYTIPGPAGDLEVLYRQAAAPVAGAALLCHPHPLYGGSMHSRVVHHLARACNEVGFATLRVNFRGVGLSAGAHDEGTGEVQDALAALEHLAGMHRELPLAVGGHSFGAWVGLQAGCGRPEVQFLVGAGLPVALYDFGFLRNAAARLLVVQGALDAFGPEERIRAEAAAWRCLARLAVLPGADHFLEADLPRLRREVGLFLGSGGGETNRGSEP
jgi:alpha/beta superfamily hydrolase